MLFCTVDGVLGRTAAPSFDAPGADSVVDVRLSVISVQYAEHCSLRFSHPDGFECTLLCMCLVVVDLAAVLGDMKGERSMFTEIAHDRVYVPTVATMVGQREN